MEKWNLLIVFIITDHDLPIHKGTGKLQQFRNYLLFLTWKSSKTQIVHHSVAVT